MVLKKRVCKDSQNYLNNRPINEINPPIEKIIKTKKILPMPSIIWLIDGTPSATRMTATTALPRISINIFLNSPFCGLYNFIFITHLSSFSLYLSLLYHFQGAFPSWKFPHEKSEPSETRLIFSLLFLVVTPSWRFWRDWLGINMSFATEYPAQ